MKICDVVFNSIWYDPRVRRQMIEYKNQGIDIVGVGIKCNRFNEEKVAELRQRFIIDLVDAPQKGKRNVVSRIFKKWKEYHLLRDAMIAQKPDVIHANDITGLIPGFWAAKKLKCRLIYDSHEINVENYTTKKRKIAAFVMKAIESYMVKRVDLMVCVSHAAAEYFEKEYKIKRPMVVTNCALSEDIPSLENMEKNDGFEILNHGQFYEGRGYDVMAQACELLKDYPEMKFAVRGFGKLEEFLHNAVDACSNPEQFRFYPKVLVQELIPQATRSHVGVAITEPICLNFKLSVSNKLFEYAAAGLPVIMSDIPEHRYLNDKYDFGIIIPDNSPQSLADAAIRLYTDKDLYQRLAENAKILTREVNWETEFGRLVEVEQGWVAEK